jgi:hypothetical protein
MNELFDKIVKFIDPLLPINLAPDKKAHLVMGFLISLIFGLIFTNVIGLIAGAVAAVGKEIRDEIAYGGFDLKDLYVTIGGALIAFIIVTLLK